MLKKNVGDIAHLRTSCATYGSATYLRANLLRQPRLH